MNILIVNKYYFISGGPETYMFSITKSLEAQGHKVIPLALDVERNFPSPYSNHFLPSPFGKGAAMLEESTLGIFQKLGLAARTIYYCEAKKRVADIVEQEKIDVVYLLNICNYIGPSVIDGAKSKGARVIMRLSDFNFICATYYYMRDGVICTDCKRAPLSGVKNKCFRGSRLQTATRSAAILFHKFSGIYQKVDGFICPSNMMVSELIDFGIPRQRVHYIPSFIDVSEFQTVLARPIRITKEALYFGRLSREKGVDILLKAWALMGKDAPSLRIVGSGEDEKDLYELAKHLKLSNVFFEPFLDRQAIMEKVKDCTFVIIPSICHDNAPMAAFESMALGKAIIASNVGGLPDQVDDGQTGLLFPAGDIKALASCVLTLANSPDLLQNMEAKAMARTLKNFSPKLHMERLMDVFHG